MKPHNRNPAGATLATNLGFHRDKDRSRSKEMRACQDLLDCPSHLKEPDHSGLKAQESISPLFDNFLVDRIKLSEILSLAPSTISKMMAEDGLPNYKIGKSCRFKVSEVMAFLEKRKRP